MVSKSVAGQKLTQSLHSALLLHSVEANQNLYAFFSVNYRAKVYVEEHGKWHFKNLFLAAIGDNHGVDVEVEHEQGGSDVDGNGEFSNEFQHGGFSSLFSEYSISYLVVKKQQSLCKV